MKRYIKLNIGVIIWAIDLAAGVTLGFILDSNEEKESDTVLDKPDVIETASDDETVKEDDEVKNEPVKQEEVKIDSPVSNEEQQPKVQEKQEKDSKTPKTENKKIEQPKNNNTGAVTTYRNEKMGIELTFPARWDNKYIVRETTEGIVVSYIFQHDYYIDPYGNKIQRGEMKTRYLFCIKEKAKLDENLIAIIDGIPNVPKYKTIHGKEYVIGGPTDCLENGDPDRLEVQKFLSDLPGIINNLKEI